MSRLIKRYENRKMYDTEEKSYISFEEIANLIRKGVDVQVIDNKTNEDITPQTLTQLIVEEGKKGRNPLSKEVLHDVIRWGNTVLDDGIKQVREKLDNLVPPSITNIFKEKPEENMDHLRERLEALEKIVNNLDNTDRKK